MGPPPDSGQSTAQAKHNNSIDQPSTDWSPFLLACQGKGSDLSPLPGTLDRIEQKLEDLRELPSQIQRLSVHLGELQHGLWKLGEPQQQPKAAPSFLQHHLSTSSINASAGSINTRRRARLVRDSKPWDGGGATTGSTTDSFGMRSSIRSDYPLEPVLQEQQQRTASGAGPMAEVDQPDESEVSRRGSVQSFRGSDPGRDRRVSGSTGSACEDSNNTPSNSLGGDRMRTRNSGPGWGWELSLTRHSSLHDQGAMAARATAIMTEMLGDHRSGYTLIMRPDWLPKLIWDLLMISTIVLNAMVVPYSLVYNSLNRCMSATLPMTTIMHLADAMWLLGIPINFITGYMERNGQLIMYPRFIAKRYARGWLLFDLLMLWPLLLLPTSAVACTLFGLVKILRAARLFSLFAVLQRSELQVVATTIKSIVAVAMPAHIMACLWRIVNRADGSIESVSGGPAGWFPHYVEDSYWVLMTMTTVGYGDVTPSGTLSRLFSIFAMVVASVLFGTIVSVMSQAITPYLDNPDERRVARAMKFMQRRGVDRELISRVGHSLRRRLQQRSETAMDSDLFRLLTPTVQRELALALLQEVVLQFPLFKGVNRSFIGELAQAQVWMQCSPGDIVAEDGQLVREIVFVIQGRLIAFFGPSSNGANIDQHLGDNRRASTVAASTAANHLNMAAMALQAEQPRTDDSCRIIDAGAWFGEACLFDETRIRTATILAKDENDLAVLSREDFFAIIQRYPRLAERHSKLQLAIENNKVSIEELAYHD